MTSSPPSSSMLGNLGQLSSPPPNALIGAAGSAGMNGLQQGNAAAVGASPITPPGSAAAAAAGGVAGTGLGLSSIRLNPINTSSSGRGLVAVAAGSVGERRVSGVYRGTVVRGPGDVGDELTIDNCIECHIYVLAPVR
jgi:hypothetical protein